MNEQPEALRLADILTADKYWSPMLGEKAAAELRRLHEVNQSLMEQNTELDKKLSEWVGLTEDELYEIFDAADDGQSPCGVCGACGKCSREVAIAEAVEAKLKEKNT